MRYGTAPLHYDLTSTSGSKEVSITPDSSIQSGKFLIGGIAPKIDDMRNYLTRVYLDLQFVFDADAAGNAVTWDKLAKGLDSAELISPVMGLVYPRYHTRGATLMHLIDVVSLGYQYPQGARTQIPADTDADYTVNMFYVLPLAHDCLIDPLETAQWTGFFDNGSVEAFVAPSTIFDGDYAGAVTESVVLRASAETVPSPREFLGVPFQWRRRQIAGGGDSPTLRNVGAETSQNGIDRGCGLAGLFWLTNATGIGLGGPDGVDNISAINMDWRSQKNIQNLDPIFHAVLQAQEKRTSPVSNGPAAALGDYVQWPKAMGSTNMNRPSKDAEMMLLPLVFPGRNLHTAKTQRIVGDLQIDMTTATSVTAAHEFMSFELLEFTSRQLAEMTRLGGFSGKPGRKSATGGAYTDSNLRYTAWEFRKQARA